MIGECMIGGKEQSISERCGASNWGSRDRDRLIGERENLGASDRGVIKIKNTVRNE